MHVAARIPHRAAGISGRHIANRAHLHAAHDTAHSLIRRGPTRGCGAPRWWSHDADGRCLAQSEGSRRRQPAGSRRWQCARGWRWQSAVGRRRQSASSRWWQPAGGRGPQPEGCLRLQRGAHGGQQEAAQEKELVRAATGLDKPHLRRGPGMNEGPRPRLACSERQFCVFISSRSRSMASGHTVLPR